MKVQGYSLPQVEVMGVHTRLYPHQAAMLNQWNTHDAFVLVTKTGSGKTRAVALPVLKHHESAVFVYPTNALIADQARAIQQLMQDENITCRPWMPDNANEKLGEEEYALIQISALTLENFCKAWHTSNKGEVLKRLLASDKRKVVLVNPDVLFLIFSLQYRGSAEAIGYLQDYPTVVFDEFHLYNGVELAHALFMIYLARQMGTFKRVVLLSATPNKDVRTHLESLLRPAEIDANVSTPQSIIGKRTVAHDVELHLVPISHGDTVETAKEKVLGLLSELRQLQLDNAEANARGEYVPCVVILNSVVSAIALEDALVKAGILRNEIAPIRGLSARSSRDVNGKLIVIGTAAIEVGIDFQADYLLFEAGDAASFMQRFGRIGRHRLGRAILLCTHREAAALESLGDEISRTQLENQVALTYIQQDARAWFISTFGGMVSICAQAHNFKRIIAADRSADDTMKERINQWVDEKLANYAAALGAESKFKQARLKMKREWFAHYAEIQAFRTSLPNVEVWDRDEKYERGRDPNYSADINTLLTRASVQWNDKYNRIEVRNGYNQWHQVWFAKSFDDTPERVGVIETTGDLRYLPEQMQFMQDGHPTSVSHLMHHPKFHIFVFAPYDIKDKLDWRIAWFRCGKNGRFLIAFDGDALLLKEILEKKTE